MRVSVVGPKILGRDYCRERGTAVEQCGKVPIASDEADLARG
jgi:hypothetical protein